MPWLTASFPLTAAPSPNQLPAHASSNISLLSAILRACHKSPLTRRPLVSRQSTPLRLPASMPNFFDDPETLYQFEACPRPCFSACRICAVPESVSSLGYPVVMPSFPTTIDCRSSILFTCQIVCFMVYNYNRSSRRLVSVLRRAFHVVVV